MSVWIPTVVRSQSRQEVQRQYSASHQVERQRLILAILPFAVASLYLPPLLCLGLGLANAILETVGLRLMNHLDPQHQPGRYVLMLASFSLSQVVFTVVPALIWQNPDGFAKAFATAMYFVNLVHLATVRAVHCREGELVQPQTVLVELE